MRALPLTMLVVLGLLGTARADLGILRLSKPDVRPGERVGLVASGYLGPRPWQPMPVVVVPRPLVPRPMLVRGGLAAPQLRRSELRPPRFRVVGAIRRWQAASASGASAVGRLRFRVPQLPAGRYALALFCDACAPGSMGSVIVDSPPKVLRVHRC